MISVARNPFAESTKYVAIMVAGIHGPGTAHALRALSVHDFRDHPLGGVIEVRIDTKKKPWGDRIHSAWWEWQTQPYDVDKLLRNLERARQERQVIQGEQEGFANLSEEEIDDCLALVRDLENLWGLDERL